MFVQWFPIFAFASLVLFSCGILYHLARAYSSSFTSQVELWELPESELRPRSGDFDILGDNFAESYFEVGDNDDDSDDSRKGLLSYGTMRCEPRRLASGRKQEMGGSGKGGRGHGINDATIVYAIESSMTTQQKRLRRYDPSDVPLVVSDMGGLDVVTRDFAHTPTLRSKLPVASSTHAPAPSTRSGRKKGAGGAVYKEVKKSLQKGVGEQPKREISGGVSEDATALLNEDTVNLSSWLSPTREEIRKEMENNSQTED